MLHSPSVIQQLELLWSAEKRDRKRYLFFFFHGHMHRQLLEVGVGGNSIKGTLHIRLVKYSSIIQCSVNILPESKFTIFAWQRRKSKDVESLTPRGFLVRIAALRTASLFIQFDQRVIFSYTSKFQELLNTELWSSCWIGEHIEPLTGGSFLQKPISAVKLGVRALLASKHQSLIFVEITVEESQEKTACWVSHVTCTLLLEEI